MIGIKSKNLSMGKQTMWKPDLCIYHGGCDDGFGAAYSIREVWPECEFFPAVHGEPLPSVEGRNVLFVDFSPKDHWIVEKASEAETVVIIDHHVTAESDLAALPKFSGSYKDLNRVLDEESTYVAVWFDMEKSGAAMAWMFANSSLFDLSEKNFQNFHNFIPKPILLIQDRDLWKYKFGDETRRFTAALRTYPQDFEVWEEIIGERPLSPLLKEGESILRANRATVEKILPNAYLIRDGVPILNCPGEFASDAGHRLLELYPDAPYSMTWYQKGQKSAKFSLRSADDRADVSVIAKEFGGGGHRNAAGFTIDDIRNFKGL